MKILFVGDKPSARMKIGAKPFEGAKSEPTLKKWIDELAISHYHIVNQVGTPLAHFIKMYDNGAICIALGNNASKALSDAGVTHFKLPHPSGRNRQLNNNEFIKNKLIECKQWIEEMS